MAVHSEMKRESIGALIADMGFALWRLRHRGASFGEFYARRIGTPPVEPAEFRSRGADCFKWFRERNLRPDMSCIDYGCGSLEVGQHFIEHLDPGHYLGLDIVDSSYRDGLALISGKLVASRQPRFMTINEEALARAREMRPDLVFSTAFIQHVPPQELSRHLGNIIAMMHEHTTAIVHFKTAPITTRIAANGWAHPPVALIAAIGACDPDMPARIEDAGNPGAGLRRDALIFSRDIERLSRWLRQAKAPALSRRLDAASA